MSYIFIAILAYFFTALATVFDKFLISSKKVSHPVTYTFFVGLFSAFTLVLFFPFGFHMVDFASMLGMFVFALFYSLGILMMFFCYRRNEASRVVPVVGVFTTLTTFLISWIFLEEFLTVQKLSGVIILLVGGIMISLKFRKNDLVKIFDGFTLAVMAGISIGIGFAGFKYFYNQDNFFNVFIWTRLGMFLSALSLLIIPSWRKEILKSFKNFGKNEKREMKTGVMFVGNKILGGIGSVLINLAFFWGNIAVVNALVATEYAFVFAASIILSLKFPTLFKEKKERQETIQKIVAIILIGIGVFLVK